MSSFNKSFAAARKAGKKTFTWNGKSYTTKLASDKKTSSKTPKNVPVPKQRPAQAAAPRARADYPRPAKDVGIAKASSPLGQAAAAQENKARKAPNSRANANQNTVKKTQTPARGTTAKPKQGPVPEGVWYARKGSPISVAAARRANRPRSK